MGVCRSANGAEGSVTGEKKVRGAAFSDQMTGKCG
jgi:hypothetical protein